MTTIKRNIDSNHCFLELDRVALGIVNEVFVCKGARERLNLAYIGKGTRVRAHLIAINQA